MVMVIAMVVGLRDGDGDGDGDGLFVRLLRSYLSNRTVPRVRDTTLDN